MQAANIVYRLPAPVDDKPFNLNYGFHDGMFKTNVALIFIDQIKLGYDHGFRSIEDNGMMGPAVTPQKQFDDTLQKRHMNLGIFKKSRRARRN